jgi:integrase
MGRRTFTETWIKNLRPVQIRRDFTEAGRPGFMLRVWPGGQKTFVIRYTRDGHTTPLTLGQWPAMSLAEAHEEHAAARKQFTRGLDPKVERERTAVEAAVSAKREKSERGVTVRNVIAEWAWHYARKNRKHPREAVRLLRVYIGEPWKKRPAKELTRRDAVLLLDKIKARAPVMANRIRDLSAQAFTFCVSRDLIAVNPFIGVPRPGGHEAPRERKLNREEIATFWRCLDREGIEISKAVRLGLKLILVTAQRPGEVTGATWDEIDIKGGKWTISAARSKNGKAHEVPLTSLAVEIIEELRTLAKNRPHLLPSVQSKLKRDEPLSQRALSRALRNNQDDDGQLFGGDPYTPHDLRRSAASMMTALGIPRLHVSKVLNHTDQDITGAVYDRHSYWTEKQRALQMWSDDLRAMIAGKKSKVTRLGKVA